MPKFTKAGEFSGRGWFAPGSIRRKFGDPGGWTTIRRANHVVHQEVDVVFAASCQEYSDDGEKFGGLDEWRANHTDVHDFGQRIYGHNVCIWRRLGERQKHFDHVAGGVAGGRWHPRFGVDEVGQRDCDGDGGYTIKVLHDVSF